MKGYIDNYNFEELECMKYWAPPSTWSNEKKKEEARKRVYSGDFLGARKMDGALYVFLKDEDGNITLRGRSKSVNGEYIDKWDRLPHLLEWASKIPNGTCFLGEVYWPGHEGSNNTGSIMNCLTAKAIERQKLPENKLHYYIFDCLASDGESWMDWPADARFDELNAYSRAFPCEFVEWAEYYTGDELWQKLQEILTSGGEGIVITHKNALYEPGKRPSKTTLKIKKEISDTIDVFVIGKEPPARYSNTTEPWTWQYWENNKTGELVNKCMYEEYFDGGNWEPITKAFYYDWPGSFIFGAVDSNNKIIPVCKISGLSEEVLSNYENYKGKVAEVSAMEIMYKDGKFSGLRHPRLIQFRDDKTPKDCKMEDIVGG